MWGFSQIASHLLMHFYTLWDVTYVQVFHAMFSKLHINITANEGWYRVNGQMEAPGLMETCRLNIT